jgi:hypothetical protein
MTHLVRQPVAIPARSCFGIRSPPRAYDSSPHRDLPTTLQANAVKPTLVAKQARNATAQVDLHSLLHCKTNQGVSHLVRVACLGKDPPAALYHCSNAQIAEEVHQVRGKETGKGIAQKEVRLSAGFCRIDWESKVLEEILGFGRVGEIAAPLTRDSQLGAETGCPF